MKNATRVRLLVLTYAAIVWVSIAMLLTLVTICVKHERAPTQEPVPSVQPIQGKTVDYTPPKRPRPPREERMPDDDTERD